MLKRSVTPPLTYNRCVTPPLTSYRKPLRHSPPIRRKCKMANTHHEPDLMIESPDSVYSQDEPLYTKIVKPRITSRCPTCLNLQHCGYYCIKCGTQFKHDPYKFKWDAWNKSNIDYSYQPEVEYQPQITETRSLHDMNLIPTNNGKYIKITPKYPEDRGNNANLTMVTIPTIKGLFTWKMSKRDLIKILEKKQQRKIKDIQIVDVVNG